MRPDVWPLTPSIGVFIACALVIAFSGPRLVGVVDKLADRTGLGEAFFGIALLGGITSISGSVLSVTAALDDVPRLAYSNAVGGIAAQTVFLVVADATYRRSNLEHAAASLPNMVSASILMLLLALALAAAQMEELTIAAVHFVSPVIVGAYWVGLRLVHEARENPWWQPERSEETREDEPEEDTGEESTVRLWTETAVLAAIMGTAGWALAKSGTAIAARTPLSETAVGALFTATTTSLPELVTTVAAVRSGALTLAVGGIVGGNAFDVLMLPASDVAYRGGSIYHAVGSRELLFVAVSLAMTAVLMLGLLSRQKRAVLRVGVDGLAVIGLYVLTISLIIFD